MTSSYHTTPHDQPYPRRWTHLSERELPREVGQRPLVKLVVRKASRQAFEADDVVHCHAVVETYYRREDFDLRHASKKTRGGGKRGQWIENEFQHRGYYLVGCFPCIFLLTLDYI